MRYVIKNKDNGKLLVNSKLEGFKILYTNVNGRKDEAWIYVTEVLSQ